MLEKKELIKLESKNKERHIPGYHFCGPGTKVVTRLTSGNKSGEPINELDRACMRHDIEYFKYAGDNIKLREADTRLRNAAAKIGGLSGILIDKVFFFKKLAENIGFFTPAGFAQKLSKNLSIKEQRLLGDILFKKYVEGKDIDDIENFDNVNKNTPMLKKKTKRIINGNENGSENISNKESM